tara:strand:- start:97 stop:243 length:147 start_codon:yes stop_codon:yes gene_type:complete
MCACNNCKEIERLRKAADVVIDGARRGSKSTQEIDILKEVLSVLERKV